MRLFTLAGIPVRLHPTFVVLVGAWIAMNGVRDGWVGLASALAAVVGFFLSVLAHELGHAFTARGLGLRTLAIVLLPFGGAAQLERRAVAPWVDATISLAGPLVNLALALLLVGLAQIVPVAEMWLLVEVNLVLGLFNLLPAFPMDGGHVLRALLVTALGLVRGTFVTLLVGGGLAALFGLVGLWSGELGLVIVAVLLVWMQAGTWSALHAATRNS
jgi:Zn-dependent protease